MRTVGVPDCGCEKHASNTLLILNFAFDPSVARAELVERETSMTTAHDSAVGPTLETAGVEFVDGNGGGPGVRLRKAHQNGKRK